MVAQKGCDEPVEPRCIRLPECSAFADCYRSARLAPPSRETQTAKREGQEAQTGRQRHRRHVVGQIIKPDALIACFLNGSLVETAARESEIVVADLIGVDRSSDGFDNNTVQQRRSGGRRRISGQRECRIADQAGELIEYELKKVSGGPKSKFARATLDDPFRLDSLPSQRNSGAKVTPRSANPQN